MALNWTMLSEGTRTPVPLPHEMTIVTVESGGELSLTIPNAPPAGSSSSGGSGGARKLKATGRFWVTDHRLIFVGPPKDSLESLSVPLHQIVSSKFEQPTFGANKLALEISPSIEGGLTRGTTAEIKLNGQPLLPFVSVLEKTRERAIEARASREEEEEGPPVYPAGEAGPSTAYDAPPGAFAHTAIPSDAPPGYLD